MSLGDTGCYLLKESFELPRLEKQLGCLLTHPVGISIITKLLPHRRVLTK